MRTPDHTGLRLRLRARRGLTMAELLITLIMLGFVGTALTKLLVQQGRTFSSQQAKRNARIVSRNSLGIMLSELRMVQAAGAVDLAAADGKSVRVEVPYAMGISCGNVGAATVVRFAPVDSMIQSGAVPTGYRWRNTTNGTWSAVAGSFAAVNADVAALAACTAAGIAADTINGRIGMALTLTPAAMNGAAAVPAGTPIFLFQRVTYSFETSNAYPQGYGLYKTVGATKTELLGPFDASSRFNYYIPGTDVAQASPPADLTTIRGLELVLNGMSERNAPNPATGKVEAIVSRVTTSVLFKNTSTF